MPTRDKMKKPVAKKPVAKKAAVRKPEAAKAKAKPDPKVKGRGKGAEAPPPALARGAAKGRPPVPAAFDVVEALVAAFATSNRINRFLVENLHEDTWHAAPPGGRGRTVAAIVCHIHNARVMWLESFGKKPKGTVKLDRLAATKEEALKALDHSHDSISKIVGASLKSDGIIANFKAGAAAFLAYLMAHDAHHRGQICLMAKQVGHPLPQAVGFGMWEWSKR